MKHFILVMLVCSASLATAQSLQLHYDFRHSIDPGENSKNFPTLYYEYYKVPDSGKSFVKFGSFLFKTEVDLLGDQTNIGKFYMQVSQEFRFCQPRIFLTLQYSGGIGVTTPRNTVITS